MAPHTITPGFWWRSVSKVDCFVRSGLGNTHLHKVIPLQFPLNGVIGTWNFHKVSKCPCWFCWSLASLSKKSSCVRRSYQRWVASQFWKLGIGVAGSEDYCSWNRELSLYFIDCWTTFSLFTALISGDTSFPCPWWREEELKCERIKSSL